AVNPGADRARRERPAAGRSDAERTVPTSAGTAAQPDGTAGGQRRSARERPADARRARTAGDAAVGRRCATAPRRGAARRLCGGDLGPFEAVALAADGGSGAAAGRA